MTIVMELEAVKFCWTMSTVQASKHRCQSANTVHLVNTTVTTTKTCLSCAPISQVKNLRWDYSLFSKGHYFTSRKLKFTE